MQGKKKLNSYILILVILFFAIRHFQSLQTPHMLNATDEENMFVWVYNDANIGRSCLERTMFRYF
jgi:hypothetical protein